MSENRQLLYQKGLEVQGEYDVVVCGGGTAGAVAALSAARTGAKVALLEKSGNLGGAGANNLISLLAYGFHDKERYIIGGIFRELREELYENHALIKNKRHGWEPYHPEAYKKLLLDKCLKENISVFFGVKVCDVLCSDGRIRGVVASGKRGLFAVSAKQYIDATADADVAFYCGVPTEYGRAYDHAVQPLTMMYTLGGVDIRKVGGLQEKGLWQTDDGRTYLNATGFQKYINEESKKIVPRDSVSSFFSIPWAEGVIGVNFGRVFVRDVFDPLEMARATQTGLAQMENGIESFRKNIPGFEHCYLLQSAPEIGVRESRRVQCRYLLTVDDIKAQRQFDDVIAQGCYMIDIHSPDNESTEFYKLPRGTHYDIPYGCLLPQNVENLLIAGRCIGTEHGSMAATRVQPICMAIGEAAGLAAAMAAASGVVPAALDIALLQRNLRKQGAILE